MTQENTQHETTEANAVHHQTKRGADMSLARKEISPDSHRAILEGRISLDEARELGRSAGPVGAAVRVNKNDRSRTCLCGCGRTTKSLFAQGHDMAMFRVAREHLTEGRELTNEQREYLETSGKMARVSAKLAEEDRRKAEREAKAAAKKAETEKADEKS